MTDQPQELQDKKLCLDCRYYQSRRDWTRICRHPKNLDLVDESPIYSAMACRENTYLCSHNANWFEEKVLEPNGAFAEGGSRESNNKTWWQQFFRI